MSRARLPAPLVSPRAIYGIRSYTHQPNTARMADARISYEEAIGTIRAMFPGIDPDVVSMVLEQNGACNRSARHAASAAPSAPLDSQRLFFALQAAPWSPRLSSC